MELVTISGFCSVLKGFRVIKPLDATLICQRFKPPAEAGTHFTKPCKSTLAEKVSHIICSTLSALSRGLNQGRRGWKTETIRQ